MTSSVIVIHGNEELDDTSIKVLKLKFITGMHIHHEITPVYKDL